MGYFRRTSLAPLTLLAACWVSSFMLRLPPVAAAAPADPTVDDQAAHSPLGEAAIRNALERKVTVSFANQSFADVLSWLKQSQRLNVAVDGEHVDGEAELDELTVTYTVQDQPLGAALKRLLSDLDLAYEVRDDVLLITTHDHESAAELRAYDVRDLAAARGPFEDVEYDCRPLISALTSTVARGHWTEYGADNAGASAARCWFRNRPRRMKKSNSASSHCGKRESARRKSPAASRFAWNVPTPPRCRHPFVAS